MLHVEWYHICWPRLTAKRVEPVVSISWASCTFRSAEFGVVAHREQTGFKPRLFKTKTKTLTYNTNSSIHALNNSKHHFDTRTQKKYQQLQILENFESPISAKCYLLLVQHHFATKAVHLNTIVSWSDWYIERFQIGVVNRWSVDRDVQLCLQVPHTSPGGHRDQQHYVCCENIQPMSSAWF